MLSPVIAQSGHCSVGSLVQKFCDFVSEKRAKSSDQGEEKTNDRNEEAESGFRRAGLQLYLAIGNWQLSKLT